MLKVKIKFKLEHINFSYNNQMKTFEHVYTTTQNLIEYISTNKFEKFMYVQIFTSQKSISTTLTKELKNILINPKLTSVISNAYEDTYLQFIFLQADTEIIVSLNQDRASDCSKKTKKLQARLNEMKTLTSLLESKVQQEVESNREKDEIMYQQNRLASMGEMIGNIAHQWRQPLNIMALVMQDIYISDQLGNLTSKKIEDSYDKSNNLLQYMSQTIDDFRNFFKRGDEDIEFSIEDAINSVYDLVSTNLNYNNIDCHINIEKNSTVKGGINEFKQVLINIINNAQDAILANKSTKKEINIRTSFEKKHAYIRIEDNGGGIPKEILSKVFDPYFTTKNKTQGTGLGLYMSKQIIERSMFGTVEVQNVEEGAEFYIVLPAKSQ